MFTSADVVALSFFKYFNHGYLPVLNIPNIYIYQCIVAYFLKYFNFEYLLPVLLFTSAGVVACFLLALSSEHTNPVKCYVRHRQILQCGKCD